MENPKLKRNHIKTLFLVLLVLLVAAFTILVDFASASFSTSIFTDVSYWITTVSTQSAMMVIIFVSRSIAKDKEMETNDQYKQMVGSLREAYVSLNRDNLNTSFKEYIKLDNRARKLDAYREKLCTKRQKPVDRLAKLDIKRERITGKFAENGEDPHGGAWDRLQKQTDRTKDRIAYWDGKLNRAEKEVVYVRHIKYVRWSYIVIFSEGKEKENAEEDPRLHEGRDITAIFLKKGLMILMFGVIATSTVSYQFSYDVGTLINAIIKLMQVVLALYTGTGTGQDFVRQKVISKLYLRFNYVKEFKEKLQQKRLPADVLSLAGTKEPVKAVPSPVDKKTASAEQKPAKVVA